MREGPRYRARGNRGNRGWGGVARRRLPGDGCPVTRGPAPARALAAVPQRGPRWGGCADVTAPSPLAPPRSPPSPGRRRRPTSARGGRDRRGGAAAARTGTGIAAGTASHRSAPRRSPLCRRPPPTAERCGPPNRARAQVGAGEHRAGRGSPGAPGRGCGNTGAIPGRWPRRGRGLGEAWRGTRDLPHRGPAGRGAAAGSHFAGRPEARGRGAGRGLVGATPASRKIPPGGACLGMGDPWAALAPAWVAWGRCRRRSPWEGAHGLCPRGQVALAVKLPHLAPSSLCFRANNGAEGSSGCLGWRSHRRGVAGEGAAKLRLSLAPQGRAAATDLVPGGGWARAAVSLPVSTNGFWLEEGVVPGWRVWCRALHLATLAPREQPCTCPIVLLLLVPSPRPRRPPLCWGLLPAQLPRFGCEAPEGQGASQTSPLAPHGHPSPPRCPEQPLGRRHQCRRAGGQQNPPRGCSLRCGGLCHPHTLLTSILSGRWQLTLAQMPPPPPPCMWADLQRRNPGQGETRCYPPSPSCPPLCAQPYQ